MQRGAKRIPDILRVPSRWSKIQRQASPDVGPGTSDQGRRTRDVGLPVSEILRQVLAQQRPRAMEARLEGLLRDLEHLGRLGRGKTVDVSQHQDDSLIRFE